MAQIFNQAFEQKLIYVYRINDEAHQGILKIGEASCNAGMSYFSFQPCCKELNDAAKERIRHQTQTAGVSFELLYTESTAYMNGKNLVVFQDHEVHECLSRSGIKKKIFDNEHKANEWFYTDLETVKKAIAAVKEGRKSLNANEISSDKSPVQLRPEQKEAVERTVNYFKKKNASNKFLWNAKMRFGKTLTALQVIKNMRFKRTIILTHRPVVDESWFEDYHKVFYDDQYYTYSSKNKGDDFEKVEKMAYNGDLCYIYFASIQDMRGSELVGGKFAKNEDIFGISWDFIIIDEAHEGTQTELGKKVLEACRRSHTKELHLSGTPFNLLDDFSEEQTFTWDYVMEQNEKAKWDIIHQGDPNPYACMPRLNIFTYNLGKLYPDYADADIAFNFREFFRVNENGKFIHEANIKQFLNLLCKPDDNSHYPYSTEEYRNNFRHSLWIIPGVKEARALSKMLQEHSVFSQFRIANVAGDGDEEEEEKEALKKVENAIGPHPEESYSITLSCGRLTTGVSVKPWTAVLMLAGSYHTAASAYMQTIFRVQTPAIIGGKQKQECFVFDFAPDRTLKVIAETAKISHKAGKTTESDRVILGNFLNFCPIIGFDGSRMQNYDTEKMLGQLKKAYVERVVRNGFEDGYLYNNEMMKLDSLALQEFDELKRIIGTTKAMAKTGDIDINTLGFTDEEYEQLCGNKSQKDKRMLSPEEQALREKLAEAKKNRDAAVSILRGISIRMPLMIYGADLQENLDGSEDPITLDNFADKVDDQSWNEFMPKGVTKQLFDKFKKYYDEDIFRESGIRIREMTKAADKLSIEERIERISNIFGTFRNPDKETVLTPWRVVNMHLTDCLGGWRFYDADYKDPIQTPTFVEHSDITGSVYKVNTHILEINSKSGLYALYMAYGIYRMRLKQEFGIKTTREQEHLVWNEVLQDNIYLICKTPMAKSIAIRTLAGFTGAKVHAHYFEDLVNQLRNKPETFIEKVTKMNYWIKDGNGDMKFDVIVGNPPYQLEGHGQKGLPIYQYFVESAQKMASHYVSMIMKANWYTDNNELSDFRIHMMKSKKLEALHDYPDARDCFPNVEIKGGICYFLWNKDKVDNITTVVSHFDKKVDSCKRDLNTETFGIFLRDYNAVKIMEKIFNNKEDSFSKLISMNDPFGFDMREEHSAKRVKVPFKAESFKNSIEFYYNGWRKDGIGYVDQSIIRKHSEWIDKYKVLIPKAWGTGKTETDRLKPFIVKPNSCCTETYLVIGPFENEEICKNVCKYIETRFFHFCVSVIKITQNSMQGNYRFVPLQNFTNESDIDWSKTVKEIDQQLYKKYGLSDEEVAFIESKVKEM